MPSASPAAQPVVPGTGLGIGVGTEPVPAALGDGSGIGGGGGTGAGSGIGIGSGSGSGAPRSQGASPLVGSGAFAKVGALGASVAGAVSRPPAGQVRVRKARLRVARVDPWSVMKVSFVLSIAMGIVTIIGTAVVWTVLNSLGVFTSVNKMVGDLTSSDSTTSGTASSFSLTSYLSLGHVEGYVIIIALVDIVLVTALATLGSYLYNLASGFVGGFEVTLAEDQ
jgi:hypothetical protein